MRGSYILRDQLLLFCLFPSTPPRGSCPSLHERGGTRAQCTKKGQVEESELWISGWRRIQTQELRMSGIFNFSLADTHGSLLHLLVALLYWNCFSFALSHSGLQPLHIHLLFNGICFLIKILTLSRSLGSRLKMKAMTRFFVFCKIYFGCKYYVFIIL